MFYLLSTLFELVTLLCALLVSCCLHLVSASCAARLKFLRKSASGSHTEYFSGQLVSPASLNGLRSGGGLDGVGSHFGGNCESNSIVASAMYTYDLQTKCLELVIIPSLPLRLLVFLQFACEGLL